jgi:hypothetical protein
MPDEVKKTYTFGLEIELAELFERYCREISVSPEDVIEDLVVEMIEDFYLTEQD